jgi:hypothetical protein
MTKTSKTRGMGQKLPFPPVADWDQCKNADSDFGEASNVGLGFGNGRSRCP